MKYISILILILGFAVTSFGKCGGGIAVFPESETISENGHIIIEAYGWGKSHELLEQLSSKYPIYLNSIDGKINLIKSDYKKGQKSWSQVLLVPEKELEEGLVYQLVVEKLLPDDQIYLNLNKLHRNGKISKAWWKAKKNEEPTNQDDLTDLIEKSSEVVEYGCGPSVETTFRVLPDDMNGSIVLAQIQEKETGRESEFYLIIRNKELKIGHDMSSGPYVFRKNNTYQIRVKSNYTDKRDDSQEWMSCSNPWDNK